MSGAGGMGPETRQTKKPIVSRDKFPDMHTTHPTMDKWFMDT